MLNLMKLTKAARGGMGLDEMLEMLSSIGVQMDVQPLDMKTVGGQDEFKTLAGVSLSPGAKVVKLSATLAGGAPLQAIMVLPHTE